MESIPSLVGDDGKEVKSEDIQELLDICQELMREQQLLKQSVKRTNQKLGFSGDSTPEVVRGYM